MAQTAVSASKPMRVDGAMREKLEDLVYREALLLDEKKYDEWMNLFTDDGYYWVPARPDQPNPFDEISIFFDDRKFMETRYRRLRHPRIHSQIPPSRSIHVLGNVRVEPEPPSDADFLVSSNMIMLEYRPNKEQQVFGGRCFHAVRSVGSELKLAWKKVMLLNCDGMFNPILLPF